MRNIESIKAFKVLKHNPRYLCGVDFDIDKISFSDDLDWVIMNSDVIVFAIPSAFLQNVVTPRLQVSLKDKIIVSAIKGMIPDENLLIGEFFHQKYEVPLGQIVIISGPCHAEEIARLVPTTEVCASNSDGVAEYIQRTLSNEKYRIYVNDDVAGCELGGVLKNPIALGCGIARGMGLGDNTVAALMTRGMTEITRLGVGLGANWKTFTGMAGIGDLIVTCTSLHSRNFRAGNLIGKGIPAPEAVKQVGTVEGYTSSIIAYKLAQERGIDTPIIEQIVKICYEGSDPKASISALMTRKSKHEREVFWMD